MAKAKKGRSGCPDTPVIVELVKSTYQPTKAEMLEGFALKEPMTPEELAQLLLKNPINVRLIDKPRNRRTRR